MPSAVSAIPTRWVFPKTVVLCYNADRSPELHMCSPAVTTQEYSQRVHHDHAIEDARDHGFQGPMIAYDAIDAALMQDHLPQLFAIEHQQLAVERRALS